MQRKTLTQRLTLKYKLIVRNEENFADRWTIRFNFLGLLVLVTFLLLLFYAMVTGLNRLGSYILGSDESEESQLLLTLVSKLDSLEYELNTRDEYISNFKIMLDGGKRTSKDTILPAQSKPIEEKISPEEEAFRKKFEEEVKDPAYRSVEGFNFLYFFPPISGKLTKIGSGNAVTGVFIDANTKKPIRAIDNGLVVSFSLNQDNKTSDFVIQHTNGLICQYEGVLLPKIAKNSWVKKGEEIAAPGAQKVVFKMVYNGKYLNPTTYIAWE